MDIALYWPELLQVSLIAIIMAISPGADFAMVTRNSLFFSRTAGVYSALGVATATWVHTAYTLAGLSLLIAASQEVFTLVKWIGALYLIYVGWKTWLSKMTLSEPGEGSDIAISAWSFYRQGFITNVTNPKTTLFYVSIFTQIVSKDTPISMQVLYGFIICLAHGAWFSLLAAGITHRWVLSQIKRVGHRVGQCLGGALVFMGIALLSSRTNQ
ncbi:amino acid transporter [Hahella sp. CCB-MM4]|uniref:LysE family translocator n=1 Tax=Hahella sp. (strain CCB-MM4) TaxID=1926491 RepID=UPI000B9B4738|nr:LysE family translocator [Hahella sp. CCB-MM4]OZG72172.1 amino acid transporter [Hahella sp. CCB-MM4]